jgi:SynChlorMet cassette protein ScmC
MDLDLKECLSNGYHISLPSGQAVCIIAVDSDSASIVERLASVMQLKKKCIRELLGTKEISSLTIVQQKPDENYLKRVIRSLKQSGEQNPFTTFCKIARNSTGEQVNLFEGWIHPSGVNLVGKGQHALDMQHFYQQDRYIIEHQLSMMPVILYPTFLLNLKSGGLALHGALVEHNKKSVLILAAGNTGKTTCCCRLPSSWTVLSDDMALIVKVRKEQEYQAAPLPTWSRLRTTNVNEDKKRHPKKTWDCQHFVDLTAIMFLEQGKKDEVIPAGEGEAAMKIFTSYEQEKVKLSYDKQIQTSITKKAFDNSCNLAKAVPAYTLRATLHGEFWKEIEKVI